VLVTPAGIQVLFSPLDVEVKEHDDAILFCAFNASLSISILWEKENGTLPEEPRRTITKVKSDHNRNFVRIQLLSVFKCVVATMLWLHMVFIRDRR